MATILIVEDEPILSTLMAQALLAKGHRALEAGNGQKALEVLALEEVDLIISDLLMPIMDGYAFLRALRQLEKYEEVPCIVLSNSGQADDLNRAYKDGATDVLVKTEFTPAQMVIKVERQLGLEK